MWLDASWRDKYNGALQWCFSNAIAKQAINKSFFLKNVCLCYITYLPLTNSKYDIFPINSCPSKGLWHLFFFRLEQLIVKFHSLKPGTTWPRLTWSTAYCLQVCVQYFFHRLYALCLLSVSSPTSRRQSPLTCELMWNYASLVFRPYPVSHL